MSSITLLNVFKFGEANYNELIGYGLLIVAIAFIFYFSLFPDYSDDDVVPTNWDTKQETQAPVQAKVTTPIKNPSPKKSPKPKTPKSPEPVPSPEPQPVPQPEPEHEHETEPEHEHEHEAPLETEIKSPSSGKKKASKKGLPADLGHVFSPDGRRKSVRLTARTPKVNSDFI